MLLKENSSILKALINDEDQVMVTKKTKEEELSIEDKLNKLEEIVALLEDDETSLENSLENFEKGIKLFKDCKSYLSKTEKKIQTLSENLNEK